MVSPRPNRLTPLLSTEIAGWSPTTLPRYSLQTSSTNWEAKIWSRYMWFSHRLSTTSDLDTREPSNIADLNRAGILGDSLV